MLAMAGRSRARRASSCTLFFASLAGTAVAGGAALVRRLRWAAAFGEARRDPARALALAREDGLLVGDDGRVAAAGARWREVPGAAAEGEWSGPTGGPRAGSPPSSAALASAPGGEGSASARLPVDDGAEVFRVLAARAEKTPAGLLVLLARVDVPFGVFLAAGAVLAFVFGRSALTALFAPLSPFPARLLP